MFAHKPFSSISKSPLATGVLMVMALVFVAASGARAYYQYAEPTPGVFDWSKRGFSDFHNGAYYPALCFRDAINPYAAECMEAYPIARPTPPYSPFVFMLHLPLTLFSLQVADFLFLLINAGILAAIAYLAIRCSRDESNSDPLGFGYGAFAFWLVFALVLASRPGHITLFTGYFTAEMVLGSFLAIHFARSKPWLSGIGLLLSSMKPTFVIPLGILMLFRMDFKALIWGAVLSSVFLAAGLLWLAQDGSLGEVIEGVKSGQQAHHDDETELPVNTWTRTDLVGMTSKLLKAAPGDAVYLGMMVVLLIVPGIALFRLQRLNISGAAGLSGAIISTSILLGIYHHTYDCLLLIVPWVGIAMYGTCEGMKSSERWAVGMMMAVVAGNYLSTKAARGLLGFEQTDFGWTAITLLNGICILLSLLILLRIAFRLESKTT